MGQIRTRTNDGYWLTASSNYISTIGLYARWSLERGANHRLSQQLTAVARNSQKSQHRRSSVQEAQTRGFCEVRRYCGGLVHRAPTASKTRWTSSKMGINVCHFYCIAKRIPMIDPWAGSHPNRGSRCFVFLIDWIPSVHTRDSPL